MEPPHSRRQIVVSGSCLAITGLAGCLSRPESGERDTVDGLTYDVWRRVETESEMILGEPIAKPWLDPFAMLATEPEHLEAIDIAALEAAGLAEGAAFVEETNFDSEVVVATEYRMIAGQEGGVEKLDRIDAETLHLDMQWEKTSDDILSPIVTEFIQIGLDGEPVPEAVEIALEKDVLDSRKTATFTASEPDLEDEPEPGADSDLPVDNWILFHRDGIVEGGMESAGQGLEDRHGVLVTEPEHLAVLHRDRLERIGDHDFMSDDRDVSLLEFVETTAFEQEALLVYQKPVGTYMETYIENVTRTDEQTALQVDAVSKRVSGPNAPYISTGFARIVLDEGPQPETARITFQRSDIDTDRTYDIIADEPGPEHLDETDGR